MEAVPVRSDGPVLEKIGMRKEGCQRKSLKIHGVWRDCFLYAILREEWETSVNPA